jgi:hypothetical protein
MSDKSSWDNANVHAHTYLKYKGVYNWKALMKFMRGWAESNNYTFFEKKFKEKPGNYGVEIEWAVDTEKKIDGFYRYMIKWEYRAWDQVPVEVIKDGKKVMMDDGRIRIMINTIVELDYEGHFEKTEFLNKLYEFLRDKIIVEEVNSIHWDGLYYEMNRFKNEIEAHLKMETATIGSPYH